MMKRLKVSSVSRPKSWRKEVKLEAAKVMKPRSELNPGVWQGDCFLGIPSGSGSRGVREMLLDAETRRRGETRGEHLFPDWLPSLQGYAGKSKPASAETAEIVRLRSEGSRWGGRLTNAARGGYRSWSGAFQCWQGEGKTWTQYEI